eukprot:1153756-Pelagomonas_calceolata.AAC.5
MLSASPEHVTGSACRRRHTSNLKEDHTCSDKCALERVFCAGPLDGAGGLRPMHVRKQENLAKKGREFMEKELSITIESSDFLVSLLACSQAARQAFSSQKLLTCFLLLFLGYPKSVETFGGAEHKKQCRQWHALCIYDQV